MQYLAKFIPAKFMATVPEPVFRQYEAPDLESATKRARAIARRKNCFMTIHQLEF